MKDFLVEKRQDLDQLLAKPRVHTFPLRSHTPVPAAKHVETAILALHQSLSETQRSAICFDWNYRDKTRGLLRTFLANHWQITRPCIRSNFFSRNQQYLIHDIFKGLFKPEWYHHFMRQLHDDTKGHPWGADQSIALFGAPGHGPCQFIITGRHLTLRADAYADAPVAFGGPVLYGHAAGGFCEKPGHAGNVFWRQAQQASRVYCMLDGRQRQRALVPRLPEETAIDFRGPQGQFQGIPVPELTLDQREVLAQVLEALWEPFRLQERQSSLTCLNHQGGLDRCSLAFYQQNQISNDAWDSWRLEGPAFVWYFRGVPHVHVWVHISRNWSEQVTAKRGTYLYPNHDPLL